MPEGPEVRRITESLAKSVGEKMLTSIEILSGRYQNHSPPDGFSDIVSNLVQAKAAIKKIQFPVVIRPSYVLGGRAMRIINNNYELENYFKSTFIINNKSILIDEFLLEAKEIDEEKIIENFNSEFKVIPKNISEQFSEKILKLNNLTIVDLNHKELEFLYLQGLLNKDLIKPLYLS